MARIIFSVFILLLIGLSAAAQRIDVQHYRFEISLNDQNDTIAGKATITLKFPEPTDHFYLDFAAFSGGTGLMIKKIFTGNQDSTLKFSREERQDDRFDASRIWISLKRKMTRDEELIISIVYEGKPKDGLIISKNIHGDRTFFADNWPTRAHYWIPCNDRPDDKASVEFIVTAPSHYQVISNGVKLEEKNITDQVKLTHWKEDQPLPTKVMVIGVARFEVKQYAPNSSGIPVTAWVYPQDKEKGFKDYSPAPAIVQFFSTYIAPFPFRKLANVQSTTIFGGMENAGAIFYAETSVTGKNNIEPLLAHEIVHQWFGDMASEKSFSHLWLSEGFATYLTNIYLESKHGQKDLVKRMEEDREQIIAFVQEVKLPVVDSISGYMSLLNANSYQKGGWVLHMLRKETGDEVFKKIIQSYYRQYKGGNADTQDFLMVAEKESGKDLKWFFSQWLYRPGIPRLIIRQQTVKEGIRLTVMQVQDDLYQIKLPVLVETKTTKAKKTSINISGRAQSVLITKDKKARLIIDPDAELLFEEVKK